MTYTLEIPLETKGYDEYLEKRFWYSYKLKREVIQWYNRQEYRRQNSDKYRELGKRSSDLAELQESLLEVEDKDRRAQIKGELKEKSDELKKEWAALNRSFGLDSSKFVKYKELGQATTMYQRYAKEGLVMAATFQNIVSTVKAAYLKRRGQSGSDNFLSVPRYVDYKTIWISMANQNISSSGVFVGKSKKGVVFPYRFRRRDDEARLHYAMERQGLRLYALKRALVKADKWKYSVLLVFDGVPYDTPEKFSSKGVVKISLSVSELAVVAEVNGSRQTWDLSNDFGMSEKLADLDRRIERSRRLSNPENFEANGTIKEGRLTWRRSKNYQRLLAEKRRVWHKIKETRKHRFGHIANQILELGDEFHIVKDDFKSLQKRKDYDKETMAWFDKRRQSGFEIMFNAPYEFVSILSQKLAYLGADLVYK